MPYFSPPTAPLRPAAIKPNHPGFALFRHYRPWDAGINIWIVDGVVTTQEPDYTTVAPDQTFLGSHIYEVDDATAALLTAAGYPMLTGYTPPASGAALPGLVMPAWNNDLETQTGIDTEPADLGDSDIQYAWSPDALGVKLVHWWDASDASTQTMVDGKLSAWTDKVYGVVASQSDATRRPTVVEDEVRFSGGNIHLSLAAQTLAYIEHTWTLALFRVKWSTVGVSEGSLVAINGWSGSDGMRQPFLGYTKAGSLVDAQWRNAGGYNTNSVSAPGDDVWHSVISRRADGGPHYLSLNGAAETSTGTNTALPLTNEGNTGIIGDYRTTNLEWSLDTLIIGQGDLSADEIARLHAWALTRRGRRDALPIGHAYRNAALPGYAADEVLTAPLDGEQEPGFNWAAQAWDRETYKATPLDLTGYTLTFEDHFTDISTVTDGVIGAGPWYAPARPDTTVAQFRSPLQTPATFTQPAASVLRITMQKVSGTWYSGHIQTVNTAGQGFAQQYGYFEARMAFNKAVGWPAFWLYSRDAYKDSTATMCEIDVIEAYGDNVPVGDDDYDGYHAALHRHPARRPQPNHLQTDTYHGTYRGLTVPIYGSNDMFDGTFHRYGCLVTPTWIIVYFDGLEIARHPTVPEARQPLYMLVSLQMQPGAEFLAAAVDTYIDVDYVRAYSNGVS